MLLYVFNRRLYMGSLIVMPFGWAVVMWVAWLGGLLFAIVVAGLGAYTSAVDWYRLVDRAELSALDDLQSASGPQDLVVAARGRRGMPIGWWVERYGERST